MALPPIEKQATYPILVAVLYGSAVLFLFFAVVVYSFDVFGPGDINWMASCAFVFVAAVDCFMAARFWRLYKAWLKETGQNENPLSLLGG